MNDPILPDESPTPTPAQPMAEDRMDRLERAMAELGSTVRDAAQRVTNIQAPAAPQKPPDEFLNDLAADPQGVISRVARETFQSVADATLNPAVLQVLDTASKQILDGHQQRVDQEFGLGTFAEVFKPQLDKDLAQLRSMNPRAMADPSTLEALVNRLYGGDNFQVLSDKKKGIETMHARGLSHLIPTGGVPRLRQVSGDELPNDVVAFVQDTDRKTGDSTDLKHYAKVYYTGQDSGPGRHRTSVLEYLKAVGADPDTLKMYGGGDRSA